MAADPHAPMQRRRYPALMGDQSSYCDDTLGDNVGRCVVTFNGTVDAERMAHAVRLTLDAEPVLGCRLVIHPWRPYWESRSDLDTLCHCLLVEAEDTEVALQRFMADAPAPCSDRPLHVALFRGRTDTLCIRISHAAADAGGLLEYLALLSSTYRPER